MTDRRLLAAAFAAIAMLTAGPARGAINPPTQTAPANGATLEFLPAFAWTPVPDADKYEFQISADAGMNSGVLGGGKDDFFTKNTRGTLVQTVPNGTYYWRVRSVAVNGAISTWSPVHSFTKLWDLQPAKQTPGDGEALTFPSNPVVLRWSGIPGAAEYLVPVATDASLASIVFRYDNQDDPNGPPNVAATSAAIAAPLAPGMYYWGVTPVDAEGNRGVPTPVTTFNWVWPSVTTPTVTDLDAAAEVYDPKFSWDAIPGAARYEVEVNPSADFAIGSKVCCDGTTIATSLSPTKVFKNDTYHWRVRAIDPDGHAGMWNVGQVFQKTFDNVPPVTAPSVKNLHMRDNQDDPGVDQDNGTAGYQTHAPVITWDQVHGASSYEVDVAPYEIGNCNWSAPSNDHHWDVFTAVNAWTPLGDGWNFVQPYPDAMSVANEFINLAAGTYCARVHARTDRDTANHDVYGDWTYLDDGTGRGTAFEFTGYPPTQSPGCLGYPCTNDYLTPVRGTNLTSTPYFTWNQINGALSYFVIVSRDANFTSIVDYGFTHVPAYAPRTSVATRAYSDESTSYYWAVLPSPNYDGNNAVGNPLLSHAGDFQKQSVPPSLLYPAGGQVFPDQPTFRWSPCDGARRYRLQVSGDPTFSNLLDDVFVDSTSYSSNTTYPANTVLYWRVRADDENLNGLTWSPTGTFQKTLLAPVPSTSNPPSGDMLPVWSWSPVQGASAYDVVIYQPNGQSKNATVRSPIISFIKMTGTGVWHWQVRAEFPKSGSGSTPGPYSPMQTFTRTISQPSNARTDATADHVLVAWDPKIGIKQYKVQISSTPDFSQTVESVTTDNTSYAPTMTQFGYNAGGTLYWRVRADDENLNGLTWSPTGTFQKTLVAPVPSSGNPPSGDMLPVWSWSPVQGASAYDVVIYQPNGQSKNATVRSPVISFIKMTGTGVWHWQVRAEFPKSGSGSTPGPYSPMQTFTRTISQPSNARTDATADHVLVAWDPKIGIKQYKVQISSTPDFSQTVESVTTDNTSYAPTMTQFGYNAGGTLYWRVAGVDEDRNQGDWAPAQVIRLLPRLKLSVIGVVKRGHMSRIRATVLDGHSKRLYHVVVRVSGGGVKARNAKTNKMGVATFKLKPRKRGTLTFRATKSGFQAAYATVKIK